MSGRYLKQWKPDWLSDVIAKIEAAPALRPAKTDHTIQPRRLDRRLSQETIAELVEAYRGGMSTPELCRRYQLSKGGVLKLLREAGVEMRRRGLSDGQTKAAYQLSAPSNNVIGMVRSDMGELLLFGIFISAHSCEPLLDTGQQQYRSR